MKSIKKLKEFIRSTKSSWELKRALSVKLSLEGSSRKTIKSILQVSQTFITMSLQRYKDGGVEKLKQQYKGTVGYLSKEEKAKIKKHLSEKDAWDLDGLKKYLKNEYGIEYKSGQSYYEIFGNAGISWKKTQKRNPKKDEKEVLEKRKEIKKN